MGVIPRYLFHAVVNKDNINMEDVKEYENEG